VAPDTAISVIISMFLYDHNTDKREKRYLEMFDVEAAFLNTDLGFRQGGIHGMATSDARAGLYLRLKQCMVTLIHP
jgi:hypothetical protein